MFCVVHAPLSVPTGVCATKVQGSTASGSSSAPQAGRTPIKFTYTTIDDPADPTFNRLLGINNEGRMVGYSGAGIVVDKHATVSDLEIGQRVAYGGEGTGHGETIITGRNLVARVPEAVSFEHACFATLGSIAMNAVRIESPGICSRRRSTTLFCLSRPCPRRIRASIASEAC